MRDPAFDDYVHKIHAVLDRLDYYRLLGLEKDARTPAVKKAFFAIASKFHPDRNRDADEPTAKAIYEIFKRLNEAYRALGDPEKRALYDAGLAEGRLRLVIDERRSMAPRTPEETIKSKEARQFFLKARDELKAGNLMQAELNVTMARGREKDNAAIEGIAAQIAAAKAEKKKPSTT
jgi:curved DNA-binding protein CbpA